VFAFAEIASKIQVDCHE